MGACKLVFEYSFMEKEYSLEGRTRIDVGRVTSSGLTIPDYAVFKKLSPELQRECVKDLTKVSRHHARLSFNDDENKWYIEDVGTGSLGSNYGTYVNNARLDSKKPYPLNDSDRIKFGPVECVYVEES